jgi:hypothetical protein
MVLCEVRLDLRPQSRRRTLKQKWSSSSAVCRHPSLQSARAGATKDAGISPAVHLSPQRQLSSVASFRIGVAIWLSTSRTWTLRKWVSNILRKSCLCSRVLPMSLNRTSGHEEQPPVKNASSGSDSTISSVFLIPSKFPACASLQVQAGDVKKYYSKFDVAALIERV